MNPEDLVHDLVIAADHTLRVVDPDPAARAGYRRALAAIPADLLPTGKRVTHTGRDHGDVVIRLVDSSSPAAPAPTITVPVSLELDDPLIGWLANHPDNLAVAEESRDRALRVIQGLARALAVRGHVVSRPRQPAETQTVPSSTPSSRSVGGSPSVARTTSSRPATFEVTIGEQVLTVDLYEERDKVKEVPPEEAAKLRYEWQRATPVESWRFTGRLALRIRGHEPTQRWADRMRWTLESRLPRFVQTLEEVARARAEAHQRAEDAKVQRRREWEEALPKARAAYLAALNRERLGKQLESLAKAERLRAYADAVARRAGDLEPPERTDAEAWADWIRAEADRHDPTLTPKDLVFVEPAEIRVWELDKYMPSGLKASHPPD